jgi:hypothetical protein
MSSRKEAMDVDASTSIPSTSSMDLMKLIDNTNRTTAVPSGGTVDCERMAKWHGHVPQGQLPVLQQVHCAHYLRL